MTEEKIINVKTLTSEEAELWYKKYGKASDIIKKQMDDKEISRDKEIRSLTKGDSVIVDGKKYIIRKDIDSDIKAMRIPAGLTGIIPMTTESMYDVAELWVGYENHNSVYSITTISQITGLSRNTVYRICKYLVYHEFISRQEDLTYINSTKYFLLSLDFQVK